MTTALKERPSPERSIADTVTHLPPLYAMTAVGKCLEPTIADGSDLVFDREAVIEAGDIAIIWFKDGKNRPGSYQAQVKQIVTPPPPYVNWPFEDNAGSGCKAIFIYRMINPGRVMMAHCSDVHAVHKCIGYRSDAGQVIPFGEAA